MPNDDPPPSRSAAPAGVEPEEKEATRAIPPSSGARRSAPVSRGRTVGVVVHVQGPEGKPLANVPRPDNQRGPTTRPPEDPKVDELANTLLQTAMARGEDVMHCLSDECISAAGGIRVCACNCGGCTRRADVYAYAARVVIGALVVGVAIVSLVACDGPLWAQVGTKTIMILPAPETPHDAGRAR